MGFLAQHILSVIIFFPIAAAIGLLLMPASDPRAIRRNAFLASLATLVFAIVATVYYVDQQRGPQGFHGLALAERCQWISDPLPYNLGGDRPAKLQVQYYVALDGISLPLLLLTALLTPLAIWSSFESIRERVREYYALLLLLHGAMLGVFCARDLLLFYVFFEFTLIPLYLIIGIWGGSQRRRAADMFFLYTLAGSVLTFAAVLYLGWQAFANVRDPADGARVLTFELERLYQLAAEGHLTPSVQSILFLALFAGFAIKVPLFPFHTWLPLAHTEAPTAGSAILAGVLLKLGTYGFLRLSLPMLPVASVTFAPWIAVLAIIGILYGALAAWVQTDIKKLVAYSSVSHLGFCLLGMFSLKMSGLTGSLLYMVNHGLSTGALFLLVGMIYDRYHTREMAELGGLARRMPVFAFFLIFFTLSSIGLPGLNGFIGEFLVLLGAFTSHSTAGGTPPGPLGVWYAVPAALGIVLGAIYMLHLCRAVLFGPLREPRGSQGHAADAHGTTLPADLTLRETALLAPLAACCLWLGVAPKPLFNVMQPPVQSQVLARMRPAMTATLAGNRPASPRVTDADPKSIRTRAVQANPSARTEGR
ncbi:MAG: NADH-quinone oxidoreductase subunit M [Phycisphaerae bacterium]|nr:NADH-quinone oxidoreductase subunit M [Phycisphaerae bacterium]